MTTLNDILMIVARCLTHNTPGLWHLNKLIVGFRFVCRQNSNQATFLSQPSSDSSRVDISCNKEQAYEDERIPQRIWSGKRKFQNENIVTLTTKLLKTYKCPWHFSSRDTQEEFLTPSSLTLCGNSGVRNENKEATLLHTTRITSPIFITFPRMPLNIKIITPHTGSHYQTFWWHTSATCAQFEWQKLNIRPKRHCGTIKCSCRKKRQRGYARTCC